MAKDNIFTSIGITPVQALLLVGGGFGIWKVGQKFGLIPDENTKKTTQLLDVPYLSPRYIDTLKGKKLTGWSNTKTPQNIAKLIKESKGFFNDSETKLWGALKRINYKTQAGFVAREFYKLYAEDMTQFLSTFQNEKEMGRIYDYFEKLPPGLA